MGGVLGGIGEYFNIDPTIVRIVFVMIVLLTVFSTLGTNLLGALLVYAVAWLLVPEHGNEGQEKKPESPQQKSEDRVKPKPKKRRRTQKRPRR